jgi:hypothetical protein
MIKGSSVDDGCGVDTPYASIPEMGGTPLTFMEPLVGAVITDLV